jgi:Icc-related predicted phosphoesterase
MRLVCISDTHGHHRRLTIPDGDVLIHAGDFTDQSNIAEVTDFLMWFEKQSHPARVLCCGNHDSLFESDPDIARSLIPSGVTYLQDTGCEISGLRFWGSPVQPWFYDLAFNRQRGDEINRHWAMIPMDTDVLVTHGPAYGKLDRIGNSERGGCEMLRARILEIGPQLHVCGHLHDGYGTDFLGKTKVVNAAICNEEGRPVREPIVVDL